MGSFKNVSDLLRVPSKTGVSISLPVERTPCWAICGRGGGGGSGRGGGSAIVMTASGLVRGEMETSTAESGDKLR
jgi:hypothetical protein